MKEPSYLSNELLSETCGLSISELEAMAARQARQLETQDQLLAAKAQRLRFLKSGGGLGEAERLQKLREKVASQEERLRKLRALRGKVQSNRNANSVLSSDLESLRAVFNEKEKELSLAVAKVEELTRQLEDLRRSNKDQTTNGQQSAAAAELEKLRRELMYRQKLREAQATRVAAQRAALNQRQEESMRVDRRIAELQERLHRKRLHNQQLAATLKHQDSTDDFGSIPNKNDPKYQTLPYNAKLFAPFSNKHEQDQFEQSMQQMQLIQVDHHDSLHPQHQYKQQQHNNHHHNMQQQQSNENSYHHIQQTNNYNNSNGTTEHHPFSNSSSNNNVLQSIANSEPTVVSFSSKTHGNNHVNNSSNAANAAAISSLQQLHHLLSISSGLQQSAKNASQQQQQSSSIPPSVTNAMMATTNSVPNGLQMAHSTQANNNVSRGKALPVTGNAVQNSGSNSTGNNNGMPATFSVIRPSNFYPTGAPPSTSVNSSSSSATTSTNNSTTSTSNNGSSGVINSGISSAVPSISNVPSSFASSRHNGLATSQGTPCGSNGSSLEGSLTTPNPASISSTGSNDTGFISSGSSCNGSGMGLSSLPQPPQQQQHLKPALPPKPPKPAPPPRQAYDPYNYNMRSNSADMVLLERPEQGMNAKPSFMKSTSVQPSTDTGASGQNEKDHQQHQTSNTNNTVRVSINRRIEMPPAFLFPESDPPPSDLIPEHQQQNSTSSTSSALSAMVNAAVMERQQQQNHQSNSESGHSHQSIQQQQQSPVSSASGDSVDASPLLMPKGAVPNHHHQQHHLHYLHQHLQHQLVPEEYTLPDVFPPHPATNQNVISYQSSGNSTSKGNKGDHFLNLNNQINSHHQLHRNAQALIESLGQHTTLSQQANQKLRESNEENSANSNLREDHNANTGSSGNSGKESGGESATMQLEANEAVIENENESCGNNLNNNNRSSSVEGSLAHIVASSSSSVESGMGIRNQSPSESETLTANKGVSEGNSVSSSVANPQGIVVAPQLTTVPGVLRRVKKSNFKSNNKDHLPIGRRVSFDPLALLLDASLEGELELVVKTAGEVGNVSAANDEGITALHNAICAGHFDVVRFLVQFGCDVNAQDSDGWTPLHCAASCNNVSMVKFLVEHGACIFATTLSDHETAAEKCEEDEDGFGPCSEYLYSIQEKLGIMNAGVVYSVFEYDAQNPDELTFKEGDRLVILRKGDEYEREWWWASGGEKEGYVPRNLLGLYPRVVPQKRSNS